MDPIIDLKEKTYCFDKILVVMEYQNLKILCWVSWAECISLKSVGKVENQFLTFSNQVLSCPEKGNEAGAGESS